MPIVLRSLLRRTLRRRPRPSTWDNDDILRGELFSIERLEEHAASLAAAQSVTRRRGSSHSLSARLGQNETVLRASYRSIADAAAEGQPITPAAEWLLDNYHVIEEQIREIRQDLPPQFYRLLPKLSQGPFAGYPRVFGMAWAFVAHTDSHFDPESLRRFVRAYQRVQPLTIGELWAVAITLRVVLLENLRIGARTGAEVDHAAGKVAAELRNVRIVAVEKSHAGCGQRGHKLELGAGNPGLAADNNLIAGNFIGLDANGQAGGTARAARAAAAFRASRLSAVFALVILLAPGVDQAAWRCRQPPSSRSNTALA